MLLLDLNPLISTNYFLNLLYQAKTLLYCHNFQLNQFSHDKMLQMQQDDPLEVDLTYKHDTNQHLYLREVLETKLS